MSVDVNVILPFLRPIAHLLKDASVTEVMVNGSGRTFVERDGRLHEEPVTIREQSLRVAVRNLARVLGDDVSEAQPLLDARLEDGSRVAAVLPPVSLGGTTLTIRKFQTRRFTADELVDMGTLTAGALQIIREAMVARQNVLISGGTGTGKTTLLHALVGCLPREQRIVLIEDTAELQLETRNLAHFQGRRAQPGIPPVTVRELVRASLRHRPDRLLIGEVRGAEAFDLLQALNTGHAGSVSTIHANSAEQALRRFTNCLLESGVGLTQPAICRAIAECLELVIHLDRRDGRRVVTQLLRVRRFDEKADRYEVETVNDPTTPCGVEGVSDNGDRVDESSGAVASGPLRESDAPSPLATA
jgi:pilus assembly protein CpaF